MPAPTVEILDPETKRKPRSSLRKYGPLLFWGTLIAMPAMNMTASIFNYKTAKLYLEIEKLKAASENLTQ